MRSLSFLFRITFTCLSLTAICSLTAAQTYTPTQPDNTLTPGDPIGVSPQPSTAGTHEAVSDTNGGLSFFLPLLTLPQRDGWNLTLGFYNTSPNWLMRQDSSTQIVNQNGGAPELTTITYNNNIVLNSNGGALNLNLPTLQASIEYAGQIGIPAGNKTFFVPVVCITNWVFTDWAGNRHSFSNVTECSAISEPTAQVTDSTDGSWLRLDTTNYHSSIIVRTKDGTIYHFPGWSTAGDPFAACNQGNSCYGQFSKGAAPTQRNWYNQTFSSLVDSTGQNTVTYGNGTLTDTIGRQITVSSGGITYKDANGNSQSIQVTPTQQTTQTYNFTVTCSQGKFVPNLTVIENYGPMSFSEHPLTYTVTLPAVNGVSRVYTLQFDGLSNLLQVTYPTGGYTKYDYQDFTFYYPSNLQSCSRTEHQIAHRRECTLSSGACSSSQELVTTYTPAPDGVWPFNDNIAVQDPLGDTTYVLNQNLAGTAPFSAPHETSRQIFPPGQYPNGTPLRTVQTTYTTYEGGVDVQLPASVTTTLNDVSPALSTATNYQYETVPISTFCFSGSCVFSGTQVAVNNATEIDEYDYSSSGTGTALKKTAQTWMSTSNGSLYDIAGGHLLDRLSSRTITDPATNVQSTLNYGYNSVGDITSKTVGGTGVTSLTTNYQRDAYGNITQMTDPKNNVTKFGYTDNWSQTTCAPSSNSSAYLTSITDARNHVWKLSYDSCTGAKASTTDPNSQTTSFSYDVLGRPTQTTFPDTGQTTYNYTDTTPNIVTKSVKVSTSGSTMSAATTLDGLGRTAETVVTPDPDCSSGDHTDTTYDSLGRVSTVSNPYCSTSDSIYGLTTYNYDALDRATQVTHPDSATILTTYTGRATQMQDEGNGTQRVARISQADALGHLVSVCEVTSATLTGSGGTPAACGQDIAGTGFFTSYQYDAFGNLLQVNQNGINARAFVYDSLLRLTSATNPESGKISYSYDADSNVATKTDARNITTTYSYDALNRLTGKTYSDGTPSATFNYDEASSHGVALTNTIGRKSSESTTGSSPTGSVYSYDSMGRFKDNSQCTPQNCGIAVFAIQYTQYDFLGNLLSATNAAGVTFSYSYNTVGRLTSISSNFIDPSHPGTLFSQATYNAPGLLKSALLGNNLTETRNYNSRLQLTSLTAGTVYSLGMSSYAPNGDVLAGNDSVNGNWVYKYDDFNRLICSNLASNGTCSAPTSGTATYTYKYDRFGNRWQQNGPQSFIATFTGNNPGSPQNNNRMDGYSYDAGGNLLNDGSHSYSYDAENRLITVDNGTTASYVYDAEGRRVRKTTAAGSLDFLYDTEGHKVAEVDTTGTFQRGELYASGRHFAVFAPDPGPNGAAFFIHADWLGTERARTNMSGTACETITSLPFGDGQTISDSCGGSAGDVSPMHFTGKERDSESGNDNFIARYYSSNLGRFMSPDAALVDQHSEIPQSWNLYPYVRNNPLINIDPNGECTRDSQGNFHGDDCSEDTGTGSKPDQVYVQSSPLPPTWFQRLGLDPRYNLAHDDPDPRNHQMLGAPVGSFGPIGNLGAEAAEELTVMAKLSAILRGAAKGKGNFGLGTATAKEAAAAGEAWVGKGAKVATDGKTLVSADGLRQYRPPSLKPNLGKVQANFESRQVPSGQWQSNGHLDIK